MSPGAKQGSPDISWVVTFSNLTLPHCPRRMLGRQVDLVSTSGRLQRLFQLLLHFDNPVLPPPCSVLPPPSLPSPPPRFAPSCFGKGPKCQLLFPYISRYTHTYMHMLFLYSTYGTRLLVCFFDCFCRHLRSASRFLPPSSFCVLSFPPVFLGNHRDLSEQV